LRRAVLKLAAAPALLVEGVASKAKFPRIS
jgi:hypothetical protein